MHHALLALVGGTEALIELDDEPLPDEAFDWRGLPDDIRPKVEEVLALCDASAEEFLDIEHRTANRRLLRDLARVEPSYFRGRATARTSAAAIVHMVVRANCSAAGPRRGVAIQEILAAFDAKHPFERVRQFRRMLGLPDREGFGTTPTWLGSRDYLTGARRAELIEERDRYL